MSKETYDAWSRLIAFLLKLTGVIGIVFVVVFWAFTGRIELAFLPFFGTMAGVGLGMDTLKEINDSRAGAAAQAPPQNTNEPEAGGKSASNEA
jgi:hypothetical protein